MKKRDGILIGVVLVVALVMGVIMQLAKPTAGNQLKITVNGEPYGVYSLAKDQTIDIEKDNRCQIKDGVVTMMEASCPDQLCVKQKAISAQQAGMIICLPNRVVLEISANDNEQQPDIIAFKMGGSYDFVYKGLCYTD